MTGPLAAALLALLGLGACLLVSLAVLVPWRLRFEDGSVVSSMSAVPEPDLDFSVDEQSSLTAYVRRLTPSALAGPLLGVGVLILLAVTRLGAVLVESLAGLVDGSWWAVTISATVASILIQRLFTLPCDVAGARVRRAVGLMTQPWRAWIGDRVRALLIACIMSGAAVIGLVAAMRLWGAWWWIPCAAGAFVLVLAMGFAAPVLVEPLFQRASPLPQGPLRDRMHELATRAGVRVRDVLVADASRRTSALNAYVSGFGATRRIVLFDSLVDHPEVDAVVAHELGHARERDVLRSVLIGAGATAAGVVTLSILLGFTVTPVGISESPTADPRLIPLVLAGASVLGILLAPMQALMSRRIEARADLFALNLTGDPGAFIDMMRSLALTNRASLKPSGWRYRLLFTHPTIPMRIAFARAWARDRDVPVPPGRYTEGR